MGGEGEGRGHERGVSVAICGVIRGWARAQGMARWQRLRIGDVQCRPDKPCSGPRVRAAVSTIAAARCIHQSAPRFHFCEALCVHQGGLRKARFIWSAGS